MDKGILTKEIDSCREELNKVIEKYNKLKEKFGALKQKRKEEKEKFDAIFLTPRSEMGLQTKSAGNPKTLLKQRSNFLRR